MSFNAGDKVALVNHHWGRRIEQLGLVERVTNTQALAFARRFDRSTGRCRDRYSPTSIELCSDAIQKEYDDQIRKQSRLGFLARHLDGNWRSLADDKLEAIAIALGWSA